MRVFINDKPIECAEGTSLQEVLTANQIKTDNVAVAIDYAVIPRGEWSTTVPQEGSKIIIIKAVQGG